MTTKEFELYTNKNVYIHNANGFYITLLKNKQILVFEYQKIGAKRHLLNRNLKLIAEKQKQNASYYLFAFDKHAQRLSAINFFRKKQIKRRLKKDDYFFTERKINDKKH